MVRIKSIKKPEPVKHRKKPRHKNSHAREVVLQALYQAEVGGHSVDEVLKLKWLNTPLESEVQKSAEYMIEAILEKQHILDPVIDSFSEKHTTQISSIVRCILRMGIFEIMEGSVDYRIIIDDLCNLAGRYDTEKSVGFVNGILDQFRQERGRTDSGGKESASV